MMSVEELLLNTLRDEELVTASVGGDRAAYAELVRRHSRRVFAVCLGVLGTFEDAEDMSQEAFVKGFTRLGELREPGQFGGWVAKIARNLSVDYVRREVRGRELAAENYANPPARDASHEDLHEAVAGLPEKYRLALVLYYFEGKSTESVARELDISPAGVLTRLSRARRDLRNILTKREATDG